jgi:hypothetical protein
MSGNKRCPLTRRQEAAIAALLIESTHHAAAVKTKVSEATLRRWLRLPAFLDAYRAARRQIVEASIGRLQQVTCEAVEALKRGLTCGTPAVEIRAAGMVLEQALKGGELLDLAERIEALEVHVRERSKHEPGNKSDAA